MTQRARDAAGLVLGRDYCYGMHMGHPCPDCRMLLRFVPVDDDTYTEGERIQIVAGGEQVDESGRVVSPLRGRSLDVRNDCSPATPSRVVATATVARVLAVYPSMPKGGDDFITHGDGTGNLWIAHENHTYTDISDHLPFVTFTPGKQAIELADVQPIEVGQ